MAGKRTRGVLKEGDEIKYFCTGCKEFKSTEYFSKSKTSPDGLQYKCKECNSKYSKSHREQNNITRTMRTYGLTKEDAIKYINTPDGKKRKPQVKKNINGKSFYRCNHCFEFLPEDEFQIWKGKPRTICKKCKREWARENRNKEKKKEYMKERRRINKDNISKRHTEHGREKSKELGFSWFGFHLKPIRFLKKHNIEIQKCYSCGADTKTELHHPSYESEEKRESVVPVCHSCHAKIHAGDIECPEPIKLTDLIKQKQNGNEEKYLGGYNKEIQG